jgi:hypothetical protein
MQNSYCDHRNFDAWKQWKAQQELDVSNEAIRP